MYGRDDKPQTGEGNVFTSLWCPVIHHISKYLTFFLDVYRQMSWKNLHPNLTSVYS